MITPEGKVKQKIKNVLKEHEAFYYMPVQNGMGCVGVPDLVGCVPVKITESMVGKTLGVFVGIEAKAPGKIKNTTPNQKSMLENIARSGGVAVVCDNDEQADAVLTALQECGIVTYFVP